ncbi:hypothetical protein PINS_up005407 [Pythium insidiosum]|nr:hypothetical protein PINS_up005407 [Pythium insidiosum]
MNDMRKRAQCHIAAISSRHSMSSAYLTVIIAFFLMTAWSTAASDSSLTPLYPEKSRDLETVPCGSRQLYRIHDLDPSRVYDVKISYPASIPTVFSISVHNVALVTPPAAPTRRELLNTAKLRLHPQELTIAWQLTAATASDAATVSHRLSGPGTGAFVVDIAVRPEVEGVSPVLDLLQRQCVYNIVVEEMLLGGAFPRDTLVLIAWLLLLLVVTARFVYPVVLQRVLLLVDDDDAEERSDDAPRNPKLE